MKTTAKWQAILGLVAVTAMAGTAQAAAGPAAELNFTIHVHNYAGVDSKDLAEAEKVASRIFQKAGVVSRFVDAPITEEDVQKAPADQQAVGLSQLWVSIMPRGMSEQINLPAGVTGLAPGAGADRVLAYVFYNRVEEMQKMQLAAFVRRDAAFPSTVGELLGTVMAHEVGHILLNLSVHSKTGIMRGNWDLGVLSDVGYGRLYFTKDQEKVMQAEVARRALQQQAVTVAASEAGTEASLR